MTINQSSPLSKPNMVCSRVGMHRANQKGEGEIKYSTKKESREISTKYTATDVVRLGIPGVT